MAPLPPLLLIFAMLVWAQTGGNGWFLISRLREELAASNGNSGSSTAASPKEATSADIGSGDIGAIMAAEPHDRCVPRTAFEVLADMLCGIVEAAAGQDDFRVVWVALQLALRIYCTTGGWEGVCNACMA